MNKVIITGRLTRDPETRYTSGDNPMAVTRISVAVNRRYSKDKEQTADFINCVAFGKSAEFVGKYFTKGKAIGITGSLRSNSWTDENGQKRYSTDLAIEETEFLESKSSENNENFNNNNNYNKPNTSTTQNNTQDVKSSATSDEFYSIDTDVDDDNLPF